MLRLVRSLRETYMALSPAASKLRVVLAIERTWLLPVNQSYRSWGVSLIRAMIVCRHITTGCDWSVICSIHSCPYFSLDRLRLPGETLENMFPLIWWPVEGVATPRQAKWICPHLEKRRHFRSRGSWWAWLVLFKPNGVAGRVRQSGSSKCRFFPEQCFKIV